MDLETACYDLREPGVIDEKLLYSVIIEQGPKGEEGRLFKQQGIVYEEITQIRLEFLMLCKFHQDCQQCHDESCLIKKTVDSVSQLMTPPFPRNSRQY